MHRQKLAFREAVMAGMNRFTIQVLTVSLCADSKQYFRGCVWVLILVLETNRIEVFIGDWAGVQW